MYKIIDTHGEHSDMEVADHGDAVMYAEILNAGQHYHHEYRFVVQKHTDGE